MSRVRDLTAAEKSIVAIARAIAVRCDLLVLDEPTAALPEADVARLLGVLRRLRAEGLGIVYVSHRLDEVFRIADRVTVLRDGQRVATERVADTTSDALVQYIVGRPLSNLFIRPAQNPGRADSPDRRAGRPERRAHFARRRRPTRSSASSACVAPVMTSSDARFSATSLSIPVQSG